MWFKLVFCSSLLFICLWTSADEKPECGLAVDAADRLAPDADKHCDYSKTGLNGALHKAFSGKQNISEESTEPLVQEAKNKKAETVQKKLSETGVFDSPQQLQSVKFGLLEAAAVKCPAGFIVETERYLPTTTRALQLELVFRCL